MKTLFEIGSDMERIDALLDECEGDLSKAESIMPEVHSYLAQLDEDQAEKLEGYCLYLRKLETEEAAAKEEAERWQAKAKARLSRAEYLKANLKAHLERTGQKEVRTATGRVIALQASGGQPALQIDEDWRRTPAAAPYEVTRVEPNKAAIREALESGEELPFARLLPRTQRLVIR